MWRQSHQRGVETCATAVLLGRRESKKTFCYTIDGCCIGNSFCRCLRLSCCRVFYCVAVRCSTLQFLAVGDSFRCSVRMLFLGQLLLTYPFHPAQGENFVFKTKFSPPPSPLRPAPSPPPHSPASDSPALSVTQASAAATATASADAALPTAGSCNLPPSFCQKGPALFHADVLEARLMPCSPACAADE